MVNIEYEDGVPFVLLEPPLGLSVERVEIEGEESDDTTRYAWAIRVGVGSKDHLQTALVLFLADDTIFRGLHGVLDRTIRAAGLLDDDIVNDGIDEAAIEFDS